MKSAPISAATGFDPVRLIETYQVGIWRYLRALGCEAAQAEDLANADAAETQPLNEAERVAMQILLERMTTPESKL